MKFTIIPLALFFLVSLSPSCFAQDFSFGWDANHANDDVVAYRIYWSTTSGNYNSDNRWNIPVSSLADQRNPRYTLTLPEAGAGQTYYFVCSAVDGSGYESDFSNEIDSARQDTTPPPDATPPPDTTPPPDATPPPQDTTPPVFNAMPAGNDITHYSAVITWVTDELSNSEVQYGTSSSTWSNYDQTVVKDALVKTHAISLGSLSQDQQYYYRVASTDSSGNRIISKEYGFTTLIDPDAAPPPDTPPLPDTAPPEFISWPTVVETTDDTAIIEWLTNEPSDSYVRYGLAADAWEGYPFETGSSKLTKTHRISLTNLKGSTAYFFRVASTDTQGNGPLVSGEQTFLTDREPDEKEPEITSPPTVVTIFETDAGIQSGTIDAGRAALAADDGNMSAAIAWTTDELSNSEVRYGTSSATWDQYNETVVDDDLVKKHTVIVAGLQEGQQYFYRAGSTDAFGNGPGADPNESNNPFKEQSFRIEKPSDSEAPRILNGPNLRAIGNDSAVIAWETDEPASSMLQYGSSPAAWGGFDHSKVMADMRTDHSVTISGLSATTRYYVMVGAMDAAGNGPGKNENATNPSAVDTFLTTGLVDETPPDIANIDVAYITDTTALIRWDTDEPANSMVQYDIVSRTWGQYAYSASDSQMVMAHTLTLTGLEPDTTYYFSLSSTDTSGNGPGNDPNIANPSEELTFKTAGEPDTEAPRISNVSLVVQDDGRVMVVAWTTDELGNSQVGYGPQSGEWGSYAFTENNPELTREHSVTLTNLATGHTYYLRVSSMDASGNGTGTSANDSNPSAEYDFQLSSGTSSEHPTIRTASDLSHNVPEAVSCFINVTGR